MPGLLKSNSRSSGYNTIGKMEDFHLTAEFMNMTSDEDLDNLTNTLFDSLPLSTQTTEGLDSDNELPDNEAAVDLIRYLDSDNTDVEFNSARDGDGNPHDILTLNKYNRFRVSTRLDPFMGIGGLAGSSDSSGPRSILNNLDFDSDHLHLQQSMQQQQQQRFSGWNHAPKLEEPNDLLQRSSITSLFGINDDDQEDRIFLDTPSPSSRSGSGTGDDSDVDIETVTDNPRTSNSSGYITQDSSPALSPAGSPTPYRSKSSVMSAAARLSAETAHSDRTLKDFLLDASPSHLGRKRKNKCGSPSILCHTNQGSPHFHDYCMTMSPPVPEPDSPPVTERIILTAKRSHKKKLISVDASDKEKQHHHNQLERNRRQKLADLFVDLRNAVPKISEQPKASKVVILNESTYYIRELQRLERKQEHDISVEEKKRDMLKKRLDYLQSQSPISSHFK